jgi:site-specific recombinase XerD
MRTKQSFGIQFISRRKDSTPLSFIFARITVNKKRAEISLKKTVKSKHWNASKGRLKITAPSYNVFNTYLEFVQSKLVECYQELQLKGNFITPDAIKALFLCEHENAHALTELFDYHHRAESGKLSVSTNKNYKITRSYVFGFLKEKMKLDDVYLVQVNYKFITDLDYYMRTCPPRQHKKPLNNNGMMKHMQRFRKILSLGVKLEWMDKNPFNAYEIKFDKVEREFLTEKELNAIENKDISIERLRIIRDMFVFSCYTGLAYIDAVNLPTSSVRTGIDGQLWIYTTREKTNTPLQIPVLPKALELIEKYKDNPRSLYSGTIFPLISNQKLNSYLKELADLCGIEKHLTFHLARHTFATTVTLRNGVPIETVSKLLGHKSISTTQIYAKVVENKVGEDMELLKNKLLQKDENPQKENEAM